MKKIFPFISVFLLCALISCQQTKNNNIDKSYPKEDDIPKTSDDSYSAAYEVNSVSNMFELCYHDDKDSAFNHILYQINDLLSLYIEHNLKTVSDVNVQHDVINYLSNIDKNIFNIENWLDSTDYVKYHKSLELLQKYIISNMDHSADKEKVKYPYEEIEEILHHFMETMSMLESEGDGSPTEIHLLYYRYLQQVLAACPDISRMATLITHDGKAALLNVKKCNYVIYAIPMLLKNQEGHWIPIIKDAMKPNHVYSFPDKNKTFYLFSEHGDVEAYYGQFNCSLFVCKNEKWEEINIPAYKKFISNFYKHEKTNEDEAMWNGYITFNPKQMRWNICYEKDGIFYPFPGSKTLYLDIDKKMNTAKFRLEEEY